MNRLLLVAAGATLLAACSDSPTDPTATPPISAASGSSTQVTTSADAGEGSLRAAIEAANAEASITTIQVARNLGTVALVTTIHYTGSQALTINGGNLVLNAADLGNGESGFLADGGGDLKITDLTIENAPGVGLEVQVPSNETGTQSLTLDKFTVRNSGLHGVLMNDQDDPLTDPATVPSPGAQGGSDVSLVVQVTNSLFENNGFESIDNDGIRINEGGLGNLDFAISGSLTQANGADGIELDERGAGSVVFDITKTDLLENGFFGIEKPFNERDLDDGIDVDEWGAGDLIGTFAHVKSNGNAEQGVDLNENEAGNLGVTMTDVEGSGNGQEGIEFEEDDDRADGGDINAVLSQITTNDNGHWEDDEGGLGDGGLKSREKGAGDNNTQVLVATSIGNLAGDGVIIREEGVGNILTVLTNIFALDNPVNGIQVRQANAGALNARIQGGRVIGNGNGVQLRNNGTASIIGLINPDGLVVDGVQITQGPIP